jgi:hypothetical protein
MTYNIHMNTIMKRHHETPSTSNQSQTDLRWHQKLVKDVDMIPPRCRSRTNWISPEATRYKFQKNMILHDINYAASCPLLNVRVSIRQNISSCDEQLCRNIATIFHMPPLNEWGWYLHGFKNLVEDLCSLPRLGDFDMFRRYVAWPGTTLRMHWWGSRRDVHWWHWELDTKCGEFWSLPDGPDSHHELVSKL